MVEMYNNFYKMGLMTADDIRDVVLYLPAFKLTPLDYEEITGQPWPDDESKE